MQEGNAFFPSCERKTAMYDQIVDRPIREASEAHVALALVLDVSASMRGNAIQLLNTAVN